VGQLGRQGQIHQDHVRMHPLSEFEPLGASSRVSQGKAGGKKKLQVSREQRIVINQ
jgi:hypothetical protein